MREPLEIVLVGRPNVGKSTLFNRLVGKRLALVDDRPGVTRDRREGEARLADLRFTVVDTAGVEEADAESLTGRMRAQTLAAVEAADGAIFIVDARAGVLPAEAELADLLRRSGRPVVVAANKAEGRAGDAGAMEAFSLGLGEPVALSAEHGEGLADLRDALADALPALLEDEPEADEDADPARPLRVAVIGRPNAGKSTLINTLRGDERLLTGPEAGITRDSIGLDWSWRGQAFKLFDTAGLRKRARVQDKLEKLANSDAIRAVQFAEVVVLLLDATIALEKQDLTLADLVEREGRAVVIALNKWDLVTDPGTRLALLREEAGRLLPQIRGAAVVPVSGATGTGLDRLVAAVIKAREVWDTRVPTAALNRWLAGVRDRHPPPAVSGRRVKLRYATQAKARPPHFIVFGTQTDALPKSYTRYLVNDLRESFALPGTPIRLSLREPENPYDK